ncbi:DNA-binding response regulator, NarL/FixJ family, contains REC and HTH domains [Mesonia phycicola]|uniref:DNA-binding response regulator, NarL/FixJ family, contains REC and HTH domains n=1 Tax=Mesonia phycicola TaxID=579105 RepID=A0A1M6DIT5_9FLAO|nr:response regulator transcription factor [Mesonia phycicola]SHI73033.1 DNA-binding response regulator, NarL/FixJ family, contains REC and HTH domains [Mesonia phycicola]
MSRINKVIIAEDIKSIHLGLSSILEKFHIEKRDFVQYCDDAYIMIKKAVKDNSPYDLLITDLSFAKDHREVNFLNGEDLIKAVKNENKNIKILVFSIEDRLHKIEYFFNHLEIDAYVCKGRNDQKDLEKAIKAINQGNKYFSKSLSNLYTNKCHQEIDNYDIELLRMLEQGYNQSEISKIFKRKKVSPSSTSTIEKRINNLKNYFKAKNTINLIAKSKDLGII